MDQAGTQTGSLSGMRFFGGFAIALAAASIAVLALVPDLVEAVRLVIRATARISLVLLLAALLAAARARVSVRSRLAAARGARTAVARCLSRLGPATNSIERNGQPSSWPTS